MSKITKDIEQKNLRNALEIMNNPMRFSLNEFGEAYSLLSKYISSITQKRELPSDVEELLKILNEMFKYSVYDESMELSVTEEMHDKFVMNIYNIKATFTSMQEEIKKLLKSNERMTKEMNGIIDDVLTGLLSNVREEYEAWFLDEKKAKDALNSIYEIVKKERK